MENLEPIYRDALAPEAFYAESKNSALTKGIIIALVSVAGGIIAFYLYQNNQLEKKSNS